MDPTPAHGSATRDVSHLVFKENFDYEGQNRIEKHKDELAMEYEAYLAAHPEITPMLSDIMQHVLIMQPANPLREIRDYVRSRARPE